MPTFRFTGDQPHVFVDIPDPEGNGTWVAEPGATIDLETKQISLQRDGEELATLTVLKDGRPIPDRLVPVATKTTTATKTAGKKE